MIGPLERAGKQQRAGAHPQAGQRSGERVGSGGAIARVKRGRESKQHLQRVGKRQRDGNHQQPPVGLQEAEGTGAEANPQRAARGKRAGQQQRQKRSQSAGGGETQAEADIEDETVHRCWAA
jgi:hypothetical protein